MSINQLISVPQEIIDLGIKPERSTYSTYSSEDWSSFCSSRNSKPNILEGMYLPRTLSAHLKQETPFLQLNIFHEYIGHGSFCEHSAIGKKIVKYEQELAEIEKQILCISELPANVHFKLDSSNPYYRDYSKLKKESEEFFRMYNKHYEGFAYWLEDYLAQKYGLQELSKEKQKGINKHYLVLVLSFNDFVSSNREPLLLEKLTFFQ